jgi:ATP-dependent RNA helicase DeaD
MTTTQGFEGFGLPNILVDSLTRLKFDTPTAIQAQAMPPALEGKDVLGSAQTGTGKTAAFVLPLLAKLINNPQARAIVLTPTRELATQVETVIRSMIGNHIEIRTALLIGGDSMSKQISQLKAKPRVIIGTPGRTNDHLRQYPALLKDVTLAVLDEADRMLDMGFSKQIDDVLARITGPRQMLMFSATFPDSIIKFSKKYLNDPVRISVGSISKPHENIHHDMVPVSNENKYTELQAQLTAREGSVIVFVKTKHGADKMADKLTRDGHQADVLHGGLRQRQRDKAVRSFRERKTRVLVATDVAARGLDIPHVEHVINYDMPNVAEDYIHRIGRTARAGAKGQAVALVTPSDRPLWNDVNRLLDPTAPFVKESAGPRQGPRRSYGGKKPDFKRSGDKRPDFKRADDKRPEGAGRPEFKRADDNRSGGYKGDAKKTGGGFKFKQHARKPRPQAA